MKIAVTGGAGFIASHVVDEYIKLGHEVVIIDNLSTGRKENINPKAKFVNIEISDEKINQLFEYEKFDVLNHHAAQIDVRVSVDNPKFDALTNIVGSLNLYEACKRYGVKKIIFASTGGAIYGEQDYFPADEEHPTRPCSPYGIAKLVNEKYLFYYKEVFGIEHTIFRYANVYGPRQNPHGEAGVVAIFCNKLLAGEQAIINGDGLNTRDYIFVSDLVKANALALNPEMHGIYNLGTGIESDVNFVFRKINELTGAEIPEVHCKPKKGEQFRSVINYEKIKNEYGWKPSIAFAEGLEMTVNFFKNVRR